jgi:hypothetical protein
MENKAFQSGTEDKKGRKEPTYLGATGDLGSRVQVPSTYNVLNSTNANQPKALLSKNITSALDEGLL